MAITGKIYLKDHDGSPVGVGQDFEILQHDGGYAAFLTGGDENYQITEVCETEALCKTRLGGTEVIVIDDL